MKMKFATQNEKKVKQTLSRAKERLVFWRTKKGKLIF